VSGQPLLKIDWPLPRGVHAAFTTRQGGISRAPWDAFNLAAHVGDTPADVTRNRAHLRSLLNLPADPRWLNQVHGIEVADLDGPDAAAAPATADAAVARGANRICTVMVADCLPVLFASRDGKVIAAAHAGWRGLAAGVLERTVASTGVAGGELRAWLGPSISRAHFEVGDEVRAAFVGDEPAAAESFARNANGRWQADLVGLARRRLHALGVADISGAEWCTYADRERFFSHRRDGQGGRMAALIWRDERG
jgi:YfiH family protein